MASFAQMAADQAQACRALGSPFTARILDLLPGLIAPASPLGQRLSGNSFQPAQAMALRLAGALHALARAEDAILAAVYPPAAPDTPTLTRALSVALARRQADILPWLDQPPQTNEVARSAVLIAAGHWLTERFGLPLVLSELGASAGLNLWWDRYALTLPGLRLGPPDPVLTLAPDWQGAPPPQAAPQVADRAGADIAPLDPGRDGERLLAYVWADQTQRLSRCEAALRFAAGQPLRVEQADAADFTERRLRQAPEGALHLIFHTIAAQYFPPETQARIDAALVRAGGAATTRRPLARLAMEADDQTPGARLTLTLWPCGRTLALGRADFHGRWVDWHPPAPRDAG